MACEVNNTFILLEGMVNNNYKIQNYSKIWVKLPINQGNTSLMQLLNYNGYKTERWSGIVEQMLQAFSGNICYPWVY